MTTASRGRWARQARFIVCAVLLGLASLAQALEVKPYSAQLLAAAEQAGRPVALHFRADWCPTCRAQDKVLQTLRGEKGLDLTVLSVDYDTERDLKRRFGVQYQSTLVVLKGRNEAARLVGDVDIADIRKALQAAL